MDRRERRRVTNRCAAGSGTTIGIGNRVVIRTGSKTAESAGAGVSTGTAVAETVTEPSERTRAGCVGRRAGSDYLSAVHQPLGPAGRTTVHIRNRVIVSTCGKTREGAFTGVRTTPPEAVTTT